MKVFLRKYNADQREPYDDYLLFNSFVAGIEWDQLIIKRE